MTGAWHARVPIAVEVAEGPDAHAVIQAAKDQIRGCALLEGIDPDTLVFRLVSPARVQGKIMSMGECPITGDPIPSPYQFTATVQENKTP